MEAARGFRMLPIAQMYIEPSSTWSHQTCYQSTELVAFFYRMMQLILVWVAGDVTLLHFRYPARPYSIIQWKLVAGQGHWGSFAGSVGTEHSAIAITIEAFSIVNFSFPFLISNSAFVLCISIFISIYFFFFPS